jgi:FHA domain
MPEFIVQRDGHFERLSHDGDVCTFGREEGVDILLDDAAVSRQHGRVRRREGRWVLEDLDSGNGTFLDGRKVARASLERGADFEIGPFTITFLGASDDASAPEVPPLAPDALGAPAAPGDIFSDSAPIPRLDGIRVGAELDPSLFGDRWAGRDENGEDVVVTALSARWSAVPGFDSWLATATEEWQEMAGVDLGRVALRKADDGRTLMVESRIGGENLIERRERLKRISQVEAAELMLQLLDTVERFHDRERFLWGLRPECVRFGDGDRPLVAFAPLPRRGLETVPEGLARSLNALPAEMISPEGEPGRRTDIYGLGAVAHYLLLGAPVADGKTYEAISGRIAKGVYKSPRERRPDLVEDFAELVAEMIALDPADRPTNLVGIRSRLRSIRELAGKRPERRPEAVKLEGREREVGERPAAAPRSAGFKFAKWAIIGGMFLVANALVYLFLKKYLLSE